MGDSGSEPIWKKWHDEDQPVRLGISACLLGAEVRFDCGHKRDRYLTDVLGESREKFAEDFRTALQAQLDAVNSGIDAIAVLVEAIHPPPGAAAAYHSVQAAELLAQTRVATSRGDAARAVKGAQTTALRDKNQAQSTAADVLSTAKVDAAFFESDAQAARNGGSYALIFERWLDQVARTVRRVPAVIIDHRIPKSDTPSIDVRTGLTAPTAAPN